MENRFDRLLPGPRPSLNPCLPVRFFNIEKPTTRDDAVFHRLARDLCVHDRIGNSSYVNLSKLGSSAERDLIGQVSLGQMGRKEE